MSTNEGSHAIRDADFKFEDQIGGEGRTGTVVGHNWKSPQLPLSPSTKSNIPWFEREPSSAGQPGIVDENTGPLKAGLIVNVEWDCGTKKEHPARSAQVLEHSENEAEQSDIILPVPKVLSEDHSSTTKPTAQHPSNEKEDDAASPEVRSNERSSRDIVSNETLPDEGSGNNEDKKWFCILMGCDAPGFRFTPCCSHKRGTEFIVMCRPCFSSKTKCSDCWEVNGVHV